MKDLNILHGLQQVESQSFGLGQICGSLALAQLNRVKQLQIWSLDSEDELTWAIQNHKLPIGVLKDHKIIVYKGLYFSPKLLYNSLRLKKILPYIIHQHGLCAGISIATRIIRNKRDIPVVISPYGSLTQNALSGSKFKKSIALALFERKNLESASCIHSSSEAGIENIRNFGLKNPIALIKNGINPNSFIKVPTFGDFKTKNAIPKDGKVMLYLSREAPLKGFKRLIEIIKRIERDFTDWTLIIAGNDFRNHKQELMDLLFHYNLTKKIKFKSPLFGEEKSRAFRASDIFILPSFSEGAPMVVLESFNFNVSVITTLNAPGRT